MHTSFCGETRNMAKVAMFFIFILFLAIIVWSGMNWIVQSKQTDIQKYGVCVMSFVFGIVVYYGYQQVHDMLALDIHQSYDTTLRHDAQRVAVVENMPKETIDCETLHFVVPDKVLGYPEKENKKNMESVKREPMSYDTRRDDRDILVDFDANYHDAVQYIYQTPCNRKGAFFDSQH